MFGNRLTRVLQKFPCCQFFFKFLNGEISDLFPVGEAHRLLLQGQPAGSVTCTCLCLVFSKVEQSSVPQVGVHIMVRWSQKFFSLLQCTLPSGGIEQGLPFLDLNLINGSMLLHGQSKLNMWGPSGKKQTNKKIWWYKLNMFSSLCSNFKTFKLKTFKL